LADAHFPGWRLQAESHRDAIDQLEIIGWRRPLFLGPAISRSDLRELTAHLNQLVERHTGGYYTGANVRRCRKRAQKVEVAAKKPQN
jgi:pyridoxine 5'-phosphate synthase PdxJ